MGSLFVRHALQSKGGEMKSACNAHRQAFLLNNRAGAGNRSGSSNAACPRTGRAKDRALENDDRVARFVSAK